jgi:hypothetical protein
MASLFERMNIEQPAGVARNKKAKPDRSPYVRRARPPRASTGTHRRPFPLLHTT